MCNNITFDETIQLKDNAMLKHKPELFDEWNFKMNDEIGLDVYEVTKGQGKKAWWKCPKCDSSYDMKICDRTGKRKGNCPYCAGMRVNHTNSLASKNPSFINEWNYDKNNNITPHDVTSGSDKKCYWICSVCKGNYKMSVRNKTSGTQCPCCKNKQLKARSLATLKPDIAAEWHPTKNGDLTPYDVVCGSEKKVHWLGKCSHEWKSTVAGRSKEDGSGCPYCFGFQEVLIGFNDMWTTNPDLARLLANPEDGYKYRQSSSVRLDWKCLECDTIIRDRVIGSINLRGLSCPLCSDSISTPEKVMYCLLKEMNIEFEMQKRFSWLDNRYYDFYLTDYNTIIEMHGIQHYEKTWKGKSLDEQKKVDKIKRESALGNGIGYYIEIDARESDYNFIKNNIINSVLSKILSTKEVSWEKVFLKCAQSLNKKILELWNEGYSVKDISEETKIGIATVRRALLKFEAAGKCNYQNTPRRY